MEASAPLAPAPADEARSIVSGLRLRVLLPLVVAVLMAIVVGSAVLIHGELHHEERESQAAAVNLQVMLAERSRHEVLTMQSMLHLLMNDARLQAAFRAGDRAALLAVAAPELEMLRASNGISHLNFIRSDRTMLLRVQHPQAHGDRIDRHVLLRAQETGAFHSGYEQGPFGGYTLRVVTPWEVDGKPAGFLEMGLEFDALLADFHEALDADVLVTMQKSLIDEKQWRNAGAREPDLADWDEFPEVVVLSRTSADIPPQVREHLSRRGRAPADARFRVRWGERVAQVVTAPLRNLRGHVVGELVMVKDMTTAASVAHRTQAIITAICVAIGFILTIFIHVVLGRVQQDVAARSARLAETRRVLALEQDERQRAEQELALQQERNELLEGRARMVEELAAANRTAAAALQENEEVTAHLREAQSELLATARAAGRAEIATNVLHNVGNVLNSVNVSAGVIGSGLRNSRVTGLARAMQMMTANSGDLATYLTTDDKGRMLPGYLAAVSETLSREREDMLQELDRLIKSVDHIKDIVATQQSHAAAGQVIEPVQPSELAEDALRMQGTALARHQVQVVRDYEPVPPVPLDRGRVLQILVNLISNAKAAMADQAGGESRLTLHVGLADGERLRFSVSDEGEGIPPENMTRIFSHGFTTRQGGHGFGLHSSALAARQMGGRLTAHSDGPGRGATFTLEFPLVPRSGPDEA
jgi:signal transduction histidine kinase